MSDQPSHQFWDSPARVVRTETPDATGPIGEGPLREMVELFLAQPEEERHTLRLDGDELGRGLDLTQVQELHSRSDFPGAY